jgi:hypothetical protein
VVSGKEVQDCPALVVHACNPRYSGGRDQEDYSLKPAHYKKGLMEWLKVKALSSSPSTTGKKKCKTLSEK